jgi:hypothetical protein
VKANVFPCPVECFCCNTTFTISIEDEYSMIVTCTECGKGWIVSVGDSELMWGAK